MVFVIAIGVIINIGVVTLIVGFIFGGLGLDQRLARLQQCGLQHPTDAARRACVLNSLDMQTNKPIYQLPR